MECFKAEVSSLSANAANESTKPNKESMEYAIVALIRCFSAQADAFRTYLQVSYCCRGLGLRSWEFVNTAVFFGFICVTVSWHKHVNILALACQRWSWCRHMLAGQ